MRQLHDRAAFVDIARDGNGREMGRFRGRNEGSMYVDLDIVVCAI